MTADNLPSHLSNALEHMGLVLLVKKQGVSKPLPNEPTGWKPSFVGQEPPF